MIFDTYTKGDGYYEFIGGDTKYIIPESNVILVDDESGMLTIKNIASRCTIGVVRNN